MKSPREETLKTLHDAATDIQDCGSVEAACERTIEAAEDVLDFEMCSVLLQEDDWLIPVAMSSGAPEDGARRVRLDQGLAGKTFQTTESAVVADISSDDESDPAKSFYRSGLSVPIGDVGVFQAVSRETNGFDEADVEFVELLVAHTARTIDRIRYEAELQERGARLERQNDRLEEFVSVVSHDLRNPLSVAVGQLDLARTECDSEHLDEVAAEHERMATLIEDLLRLAQEGRPVDDVDTVDLGTIASSSWTHVQTADAALSVETTAAIRANERRLTQLFENLYRNAIEHGGSNVTVEVGTLANDEGFYVADDGPGIDEAALETVFERGYSTQDGNTGFGLAIVREIVDAHGWAITATTGAAGGARFEITGVETGGDDE